MEFNICYNNIINIISIKKDITKVVIYLILVIIWSIIIIYKSYI